MASPEQSNPASAAPVAEQVSKRRRVHYEGDPTIFRVMRSPKWIIALIFALAVASGFAWLGQWQLENAIRLDAEQSAVTETVRPLLEETTTGEAVRDGVGGGVVSLDATFVPGDYLVVERRTNQAVEGVWVTGHAIVHDETQTQQGHLSVAIGWAPSVQAAREAIAQLNDTKKQATITQIEGRYMPTEGPVIPDAGQPAQVMLSMVPGQQVNAWQPFEGRSFAGYLVLHPESNLDIVAFGLDVIDSVAPLPAETINWVSLFYALEWVVFAGFALFFWYRLVRDDWEKRHEMQELMASGEADPKAVE